MKKILLSLTVLLGGTALVNAQCTPDPNITTVISPDTATNMAVSYVGQYYEQVFTFKVPADTSVAPYGSVPISHIQLNSISGQPANYNYDCTPSNCKFNGGTLGCVRFKSTSNPTSSQVGTYPLTITATGYVVVFGTTIMNPGGASTYDGYYFVIAEQAPVGIEKVEKGEMKLLLAYPNPTSGVTTFDVAMGSSNEVTFTVTNLLGSVVNKQILNGAKGLNKITFDATSVPNGVYLYTITDGTNTISKKLVVNK